ncbi:MAG: dipeptidase [Bacillota bacterium]
MSETVCCSIVDCHCDTLWLFGRDEYRFDLLNQTGHVDLPRLRLGQVVLQFFAVCTAAQKNGDSHLQQALHCLTLYERGLRNNFDHLQPLEKRQDLKEAAEKGKIACLLALEGAEPLCGSVDLLPLFYRLGVRCISLTWNNRNCFADGCGEEISGGGLTRLGRNLVPRLGRYGILLDLAHLSQAGFRDAIELAERPPLVSHANAARLCEHPRNLSDEQLKLVAERGGVIGISFYPLFITGRETARLDQLIDHFVHIASTAGINHVGIGSDFDGIPKSTDQLADASCYPVLIEGLLKRGFNKREVALIAGENVKRLLEQNLAGNQES